MECPRCSSKLMVEMHRAIEVDRCPGCQGMWLDSNELDRLEDMVLDDDQMKGAMFFSSQGSDLSCPKCQGPMRWFRYRHYNLEMDFCEAEHGFWLDKGEEQRVLEIMEQRSRDLKRSASAEAQWDKFLSGLKSRSFMDRMKNLFKK